MDVRDLDFPSDQLLDMTNSSSLFDIDDIFLQAQSSTHAHACSPPGPDKTHTHTCIHYRSTHQRNYGRVLGQILQAILFLSPNPSRCPHMSRDEAPLLCSFRSSDPELHLVVLCFLPALAGAYLSRSALHQPLAVFESVILAIYAHETAACSGQPITASIPDIAHPSIYHEATKQSAAKNGSAELHLAVISPSLEPHGTVRSTRRARILGVALELYYSKISHIPVGSKIEFFEFCRVWSGGIRTRSNVGIQKRRRRRL